jgi:hypothetical protein
MARVASLLAGALVLALAAGPASAGGWWDDLDKGESVRLSDLVADPQAKRDGAVTFACVFRALDKVFFPYFTSFTPEKHVNVSVWLDGAPIWEREAYARDEFPFLYLRRDHPQRDELLRLQTFTRIEVTGRIRDVYRARPWIEILAFRVTPATLGKDVVEYVKTGDGFASRGDVTHADAYYARALAEVSLEETYALRIRKRRGDVLRAAGRDAEAALAQGGTILGGTPLPPRDATAPPPAFPVPAAPATPGPGGDTFPTDPIPTLATPAAEASPRGEAKPAELTTTDLPGVPYGGPVAPPAAEPARRPASAAPAAPAKAPPPGPGSPPPPPRPAAGGTAQPAKPTPPAAAPEKDVVPAPAPPSPPPPPRVPRLSGVR